jgi:hypothetical protein
VNLSINPLATGFSSDAHTAVDDSASPSRRQTVTCPSCAGDIPADSEWQSCPYCQTPLQIRIWPIVRQSINPAAALSDQATCFFHPDKAFQTCCQRCGRFVCALCDLQLGAEHVCPACFERGRLEAGTEAGKTDWRYRDVLYDSIALTTGWVWIFFWPTFVIALPAVIVLHTKYRKAPRSYLLPRSAWRFWVAYLGLMWLPIFLTFAYYVRHMARRH